ncbi:MULTISPECIES: PD-(D/E)XK nuclease family protein [unclassified Ruminococcus]|uniref:PD-(D/E)XK nuclease family protein n=1 Tax=unclassified Ruminococcus TaxID=2608920 RepID=UPI00210ED898|nr:MULTISPECIES: PD-(D/E)XK nuclease family protein [unclassified Ruminococcus]MCQ4022661.1 hypothetical protein [Ruminococcus sp. zg-924]MCQ4114901.1 hypothetical protein [Ruminococcus sp. zg-921]
MLRLIFGRSGTGKTDYIINHLCRLAQDGEDSLILLVPEQHSFASEKKIVDRIGPRLARRISVLSFKRIADAVFRKSGDFPQKPIDDGMKNIFMSLALKECGDNLSLYHNQIGRADFIPVILNTVNEMKSCALTSNIMSGFGAKAGNETLSKKLSDVALISSTYNALLNQAYSDPLDTLTLIYNKLLENNIFADLIIALDGFSGFTRQELMIIEVLMCGAKEMLLTLCGSKFDFDSDSDTFRITKETKKSITELAKKNGVSVMTPVELTRNYRFNNTAIAMLEKNMYSSSEVTEDCSSDGVTVYRGITIYDECDYTASEIKRLVTEEGYKYSDIAVIARNLSPYKGIIGRAFDKNGISYYMENPKPLMRKSLAQYLVSILDTVCSGFSTEHIFKMLKTGYTALTEEEIFALENYTYIWNISGSKWLSPFTQNPEGFKDSFSESDKISLEKIEAARKKCIEPLVKFRDSIKDKSGGEITRQLYYMLESRTVRLALKAEEKDCIAQNDTLRLQELDRIWDMLIESLDRIYFGLDDVMLSLREYTDLFKLYMSSADISYIPQSLDEVTVGTADRIRTDSPRVVFMLGCIQDEFPKIPTAAGIFTDNERCVLREQGLGLYDSVRQLAANELFYVYTSVSAPSERLYASFYTQSLSGEERKESSIIREIIGILKITNCDNNYIIEKHDGSLIRSQMSAFEFLASNFTEESSTVSKLKEYFLNSDKGAVVRKIDSMLKKEPLEIDSEPIARKLFGGQNINLSASQIEKFYLCPYQYFCTYGLNIKERKKAEINAAEFGTLVHYILEVLLSKHTVAELYNMIEQKSLGTEIKAIIKAYLESYLGGEQDKTSRFMYGLSRIKKGAEILVTHIISELMSCGFDPLCCELKIDYKNNDGDIEPMTITLDDGTAVSVRGKVDRVDKLEKDGNFYIRIVDYKSGKKEFKINDINFGLNLQMLIYLKAITQNGEKRFEHKITPAGVLYMPSAPNLVSHTQGEDEIDKSYAMDGVIVDDSGDIVETMKKDGKYVKTKTVITQNELKVYFDKIDTLIIHMVNSLIGGKVNAVPVKSYDHDACKYCPYSSCCGYENGMDSVNLKDLSKSPVYNGEEA